MATRRGADKARTDTREVSDYDTILAYKQVFSTQEGAIVLHDLVRRFGYTRVSTFDDNPTRHALKEGQRTVLVHVGRMIDADPAEIDETRKQTGEM